jgi:hypothetical protein
MLTLVKRLARIGAAGVAVWALAGAPAAAQQPQQPPAGNGNPFFRVPANPPGGMAGVGGVAPPAAAPTPYGGTITNTYTPYTPAGGSIQNNPAFHYYNPSYGYGPYGYGTYQGPTGAYLSGSADVINAQANFMLTKEQKKLLHESVEQARIDTRLKAAEARIREAALQSAFRDQQEKDLQEYTLRRARTMASLPEITNAIALNDLFKDAATIQSTVRGVTGPTVPLDQDLLKRINFTSGNGGNAGLLKSPKMNWPGALQGPDYDQARKHVELLLPEATKQARSGSVDSGTLRDLRRDLDALNQQLRQHIGDLTPDEDIEAKRYLRQLEDSLKTLQNPNAGQFLTEDWTSQVKNVGELIKYMSSKGLTFAPANAGDENAYVALHNALAAYDTVISRLAREQQNAP